MYPISVFARISRENEPANSQSMDIVVSCGRGDQLQPSILFLLNPVLCRQNLIWGTRRGRGQAREMPRASGNGGGKSYGRRRFSWFPGVNSSQPQYMYNLWLRVVRVVDWERLWVSTTNPLVLSDLIFCVNDVFSLAYLVEDQLIDGFTSALHSCVSL